MLDTEDVRQFMKKRGITGEVIQLKKNEAKTSLSASKALGCSISQIAKNIVLVGRETILVILSGDRKVDVGKVSRLMGEKLKVADPETVLARTGFPVGGVPPFGHANPVVVLVDKSIDRFDYVYSSAGSPETLLGIRVDVLREVVGGKEVDVSH